MANRSRRHHSNAQEAIQQRHDLVVCNSREDLRGCKQAAQALCQRQSSEGQHLLQHLQNIAGSTVRTSDKAPASQPL